MEYGFGAHEFPTSGVFEVEPKSCPGFVYRRTVWLGTTNMSRTEFRSFMEHLAGKYHGDTYHLISKNCNHFTDDVCKQLTGKAIPGWVNRLARLGTFLFWGSQLALTELCRYWFLWSFLKFQVLSAIVSYQRVYRLHQSDACLTYQWTLVSLSFFVCH